MEMQAKRLLRTAPPPLTLPPLQPVPPTPPPSPTGARTPPTSPEEPRTPPPSPASPTAPPPSPASPRTPLRSPHGAPTPPPFPESPLMLAPPSNMQERSLIRFGRMMNSDDSLSRVAGDIQALYSKTCETFISKLTPRGWFNSEKQHCHILGSGLTTGNTSYNKNGCTRNAYTGTNSVITDGIGGFYGMGSGSITNPDIWLRIPGMMMGLNNAGSGTETSIGNFSVDAGTRGWLGMRYHYMPVVSMNVPVDKEGKGLMSQSPGMFVPVYAPYGSLPYQFNQEENGD